MSRARWRLGLVLALLAPRVVAAAPGASEEGRYVELYATAGSAARQLIARVDLDALPPRERVGVDPQYGAERRMRGVALAELWARAAIPQAADVALLRFHNGLQIPIAFRDAQLLARLDAFVVRANTSDRRRPLAPGQIEPTRRPPTEEDLRPVSFQGNKVVVSDPALAPMLPSVSKDLRPWLYADSLSAIDFVEGRAWDARLDAGPATAEGRRVFLGACRFCHAVRGDGGALGWDFLEPVPIYSEEWIKRWKAGAQEISPTPPRTMLSIHVRHRAAIGGNRTMPALRGMRLAEVQALWDWLQAIPQRAGSR